MHKEKTPVGISHHRPGDHGAQRARSPGHLRGRLLQLLSGHAEEKSLALYRDLALADVSAEYEEAMRAFPVR